MCLYVGLVFVGLEVGVGYWVVLVEGGVVDCFDVVGCKFLLCQCEQCIEYYVVGLVVYWLGINGYYVLFVGQVEFVVGSYICVCCVVIKCQVGCCSG